MYAQAEGTFRCAQTGSMDNPTNPFTRPLMLGLAWLLHVAAGLLVLYGGGAISEMWKIDRMLAEFLGIGLAVALIGLGFILKKAAPPEGAVNDTPSKGRGTI